MWNYRSDIKPFPLPAVGTEYEREDNGSMSMDLCLSQEFSVYNIAELVRDTWKCLYNSTCNPYWDKNNPD